MSELAKALSTAQRAAKWTNVQVANAAGATERTVYRWKRADVLMRCEHVIRLQQRLPGFLELTLGCAL